MADVKVSAKTELATAPDAGDTLYIIDGGTVGVGGTDKKITVSNLLAAYDAQTSTLTNKTFNANGTGNSLSNVETADIASGSKSGSDTTLVTGTAGSDGDLARWNADGDLVSGGTLESTINFVIDGGGSAITTGVKGFVQVDFACTIQSVTLLADQSGSIVVDIWKDSYANYAPTDADSITASAVPTISSATKSTDSTLTGWTTSIAAGDILGFNVDSITTCERVTVCLKVKRTLA